MNFWNKLKNLFSRNKSEVIPTDTPFFVKYPNALVVTEKELPIFLQFKKDLDKNNGIVDGSLKVSSLEIMRLFKTVWLVGIEFNE